MTYPHVEIQCHFCRLFRMKRIKPGISTEMVLDMKDPEVITVWIRSKVHEINLNVIQTAIGYDWYKWWMRSVGAIKSTYSTLINDLDNIIFCNAIVLLTNHLKGLANAMMLNAYMHLCNNVKSSPLTSSQAIRKVCLNNNQ